MVKSIFTKYFKYNYGFLVFAIIGILSLPTLFFYFNARELHFDGIILLPFLALSFCIIILGGVYTLFGSLLFKQFNRFNTPIQNILFSLGIIILLNDIFIPTQAGELNGVVTGIPEPIWMTIVEVIIFIAVLLIVFKTSNKNKNSLIYFSKFMPVILIGGIIVIYTVCTQSRDLNDSNIKLKETVLLDNNKKPNIYFIWLDAMQTDHFLIYLNKKSLSKRFNGFTLFEKNSANYLYSLSSSMSFMNGAMNKGLSFNDWKKKNYFRKKLKSNSYQLTSYARDILLSPLDDIPNDLNNIIKSARKLTHLDLPDFITYSIVKMMPNFLANESLSFGAKFGQYSFDYFNPKKNKNSVNTIKNGLHTIGGVYTFNKAIKDESSRKANNEFVLVQALIPHSPLVLNEDCQYTGLGKQTSKEYLIQTGCAFTLVERFFQKLKELNRYENSLIIVMGDHGDGRKKYMFEGKKRIKEPLNLKLTDWNEQTIIARAHSLFMIKPPNSSDKPFNVSKLQTQLIDIIPTIYNILGWKKDERMDGQDVLADDFKEVSPKVVLFRSPYSKNISDATVYQLNRNDETMDMNLEYLGSEKDYFKNKK